MSILIITVLLCLMVLVLTAESVGKHGWTNLYFIPLSLVLVALILGVVGFLL